MNRVLTLAVALMLTCSAFANNGNDPNKCKPTPKPPTKPVPPPKPPVKPTPQPKPVSTSTSNSSANAAANANAASNASANVGPITNTLNAQGGKAEVSGSGNSTNSIDNKQSQSQSNEQSQSSTSSAANNGNGSNNTTLNYQAPRIPVNSAYAPDVIGSGCFKGGSGGLTTGIFSIAGGGTKLDKQCQLLEVARFLAASGSRLAACKVVVKTDGAKLAGLTLADCLSTEVIQAPTQVERSSFPVAPSLPPVTVEAPVPAPTVVTALASCAFPGAKVSNACKAQLDGVYLYFKQATGGFIVIEADDSGIAKASGVRYYLTQVGIAVEAIRIQLTHDPKNTGAIVSFSSI